MKKFVFNKFSLFFFIILIFYSLFPIGIDLFEIQFGIRIISVAVIITLFWFLIFDIDDLVDNRQGEAQTDQYQIGNKE